MSDDKSSKTVTAFSKLFMRLSVIGIGLYLIFCSLSVLIIGEDFYDGTYMVILEACLCLAISAQGPYHCKYLRWTAYGILVSDTLAFLDHHFDFLPYSMYTAIPVVIILIGLVISLTLALRHYIKVRKLKRKWQNQQS